MRQVAMIQFVSKYSNVIIQLVISMVLARLHKPNEFGAVAIAMVGVGVGACAIVGEFSLPFWPVLPLVIKLGACAACYAAILVLTGQRRCLNVLIGRS